MPSHPAGRCNVRTPSALERCTQARLAIPAEPGSSTPTESRSLTGNAVERSPMSALVFLDTGESGVVSPDREEFSRLRSLLHQGRSAAMGRGNRLNIATSRPGRNLRSTTAVELRLERWGTPPSVFGQRVRNCLKGKGLCFAGVQKSAKECARV